MKKALIIIFLLFSNHLFAQNLNGYVIDSVTKLPIANAQVNTKNTTVLTNEIGKFNINNVTIGERISFRLMGYEPVEFIIDEEMFRNATWIKLRSKSINLNEVKIKTNRNYKKDSLDLRKEYAHVFNYKKPKFTDAFIKVDPNYKSPFANINPNSTASILRINILQVVGLIAKNKEPTSKFKQMLLKDEQENYINHIFSKSKVENTIKLTGDSLLHFINIYRPTYQEAKKMNDYQVILYIKIKLYRIFKNELLT